MNIHDTHLLFFLLLLGAPPLNFGIAHFSDSNRSSSNGNLV